MEDRLSFFMDVLGFTADYFVASPMIYGHMRLNLLVHVADLNEERTMNAPRLINQPLLTVEGQLVFSLL